MSKMTHINPAIFPMIGLTGAAAGADITATGVEVGMRVCGCYNTTTPGHLSGAAFEIVAADKIVSTASTAGQTLDFIIAYPDPRGYTGQERQ
jgi:hypothetical protein